MCIFKRLLNAHELLGLGLFSKAVGIFTRVSKKCVLSSGGLFRLWKISSEWFQQKRLKGRGNRSCDLNKGFCCISLVWFYQLHLVVKDRVAAKSLLSGEQLSPCVCGQDSLAPTPRVQKALSPIKPQSDFAA